MFFGGGITCRSVLADPFGRAEDMGPDGTFRQERLHRVLNAGSGVDNDRSPDQHKPTRLGLRPVYGSFHAYRFPGHLPGTDLSCGDI